MKRTNVTRDVVAWTSNEAETMMHSRDRDLYFAKPLLRPLTDPWKTAIQSICEFQARRRMRLHALQSLRSVRDACVDLFPSWWIGRNPMVSRWNSSVRSWRAMDFLQSWDEGLGNEPLDRGEERVILPRTGGAMRKERSYGFELKLEVPHDLRTDEEIADAVYSAGCADCLVVLRNGHVILEFDRTAGSRREAIDSAIKQLERFGLKAALSGGKR